jgi:hypothetical protein
MKMNQLFLERHFDEAIRLIHNRLTEFRDLSDLERLVNPFFLAFAQEYAGDTVGARATAQQTVGPLETLCQKDPDNPNFAQVLSLTRAVLGQKDAAIKEAQRAITLLPSEKDAVDGPRVEESLASVEVLVGDKNSAIPRLQHLLEIPYANCLTPALLRLHPAWGSIARRSRFPKTLRGKAAVNPLCVKNWEIIADNLSKAGWSWGWVSALDVEGRTIWIGDAHGYAADARSEQ